MSEAIKDILVVLGIAFGLWMVIYAEEITDLIFWILF